MVSFMRLNKFGFCGDITTRQASNDSIFMADRVRVLEKRRLLTLRGRLNTEAIE